jgi:ABC-type multidrug transport system permease subunit
VSAAAPATATSSPRARRRAQRRTLGARYRECVLGDRVTLLLLVAQAPLIGWLCTVVWRSVGTDTPSLYFVLCLASIWFGCIGACRELVKERPIIERERLFGVGAGAVVLSKAQVLFALGAVQAVLLQGAVEWRLALRGPYLLQTLVLVLAAWAGVGLGLVVSALAARQERAVGAVPLLLLPQILFSEIVVPRRYFSDSVAVVERFMPLRWAYRAFDESAAVQPSWLKIAGHLGVLAVYVALLLGLAVVLLRRPREIDT